MIRPVQFRYNEQTAVNNYYQKILDETNTENAQQKALAEFDTFVEKLQTVGVRVIVIDDTSTPDTPDSIFPNNWVSFHADGTVGLYPMYAENRRLERRNDILEELSNEGFRIKHQIDLSSFETKNKYLEGTGSLVFDRENKIAYAAISERTHPDLIEKFNDQFGFRSVTFTAYQTFQGQRLPIYHTNVMMCMGDGFSVICLDCIDDRTERDQVVTSLTKTDREVVEITENQMAQFAGNMLQIENERGEKLMVMSAVAYGCLQEKQIDKILKYNKQIIHSSLDTIEALGGGSARCMMAEVFLPK